METIKHKESLTWSSDLSVGIEELDNHHQELIRMINMFKEAMEVNAGSEKISEIILELFNYANYHFGAEEALFQLKDYPFTQEHCERHLEFRENLAELRDQVDAGIDGALPNLLSYLHSWVVNHVMQEDKKYIPYFKV